MEKNGKLLGKYFLEKFPESISQDNAFHCLLLVTGEKPGVMVFAAEEEQIQLLKNFTSDFDLAMETVRVEDESVYSELSEREKIAVNDQVYIARNEERFEILASDQEGLGYTLESVGKFLGYPEEDVSFYSENARKSREREERPDPVPVQLNQKVEEMQGTGELSGKEIQYINLVGYVPAPFPDSIRNAVQIGRKRAESLEKLDRETDLEIGRKYLDELLEKPGYLP